MRPEKLLDFKLIQVLQTLNKSELTRFYKFLNSSYFSQSERPLILFKELKKYYPKFDNSNWSREKLYRKLFPQSSSYKSKKISDAFSDLTLLLEKFMLMERIERDDLLRQSLLVPVLRDKRLNQFLDQVIQKGIQLLAPEKNNYLFENYIYELSFYNHLTIGGELFNAKEKLAYTDKMFSVLDEFYLLSRLKCYCSLWSSSNFYRFQT